MMKQILFVIVFSAPLFGQLTGNAQLVLFPGAPSGSCTSRQMGLNQSNGSLYVCINSAWQVTAGAGGNATGLNFSGTTIPLGSPAPTAGQFLEFNGTHIIGGTPTGGGTALTGCATPSPGNLVCDNYVQGGIGNVGMLTMPFSAGGLPAPPTGSLAAIAPDSAGHLFWSPGNSTQFTAIGTGGGGGGTGTASALQFSQTTFGLSATAPTDGQCLAASSGTIIGTTCGGGITGNLGGVTIVQ